MSNDPVIQQALADLDSADYAQRIAALHRLRSHQDDQIAPRLIPLLRDPDPAIRRLTAQVLGKNGSRAVVQALIDLLYDKQADVRAAAVDALGQIGDRSAVPPLIDALYDEAVDVRFAAADALGALRDSRAVIDLITMLDNDDAPLAAMAAMALHQIGTPEALAAIQHLRIGDDYIFDVPEKEPDISQDDTLRHIPPSVPQQLREGEVEETWRSPRPAPPTEAQVQTDLVQFAGYYPREVTLNIWNPLRAYVFYASAADAVAADAAQELGGLLDIFRQVARDAQIQIQPGSLITATPELEGFQFNPPTAQVGFYERWHRFDFKLRAVTVQLDHAVNGRITFSVEGIIVADIPLSVYVGGSVTTSDPTLNVTRPIYRAIFCSYSHEDTQIVERVERAYKALGLDFLRDVATLKSGQNWNAELLKLIEQADIFQLFWSHAAAQSKYVRREWKHALSLNRQDEGFIRPVYWQQPIPPIPPELSAIHFAYEPTLDDL